jgi:hypothetical protein
VPAFEGLDGGDEGVFARLKGLAHRMESAVRRFECFFDTLNLVSGEPLFGLDHHWTLTVLHHSSSLVNLLTSTSKI